MSDPNESHVFVVGPTGRCDYGDTPCGRAETSRFHIKGATTASRPHPSDPKPRPTRAQRGVPWADTPAAGRVAIVVFGSGAAVVWASGCAAAARWLLERGGW